MVSEHPCSLPYTRVLAAQAHYFEFETSRACCRSRGGIIANLRVLEHGEQLRLLGVVQRCSAHSVDYASPDPSLQDVRRLSERLNTSASIARTILDQARRARDLLIRFNVRLCAKLARKYVRPAGVDLETLIAEACAGLNEAIERFDRSRNMKFTTYATHWILRNLRLCVVTESGRSPVQLPAHIHYKLSNLLSVKEQLLLNATAADRAAYESNSEFLNEAIAQKAGMSVRDVTTLLTAGLPTLDLDRPLYDDSSAGEHIDHLVQTNDVRSSQSVASVSTFTVCMWVPALPAHYISYLHESDHYSFCFSHSHIFSCSVLNLQQQVSCSVLISDSLTLDDFKSLCLPA